MRYLLLLISLIPAHVFALSFAPPQITPSTNTLNGATTLPSVHCILFTGKNKKTVDGVLTVNTNMLCRAVNLAEVDELGILRASKDIDSEVKGDLSVFWFTLKKDYLFHPMVTIFTKDKMYEFRLKSIPLRTDIRNQNDALELILKEIKKRPSG